MNFTNHLETSIKDKDSLLCVGIDPIIEKVPGGVKGLLDFCRQYIDETVKHAAVFKPQAAYFAALEWWEDILYRVIEHAKSTGTPVVLDVKRGDIDRTSEQYAHEAFRKYGADATTVNPYMGEDVVTPYIQEYPDRWLFVLGRTSNKSAPDFQDLELKDGRRMWQEVVRKAAQDWNEGGQIGIVAGATYPEDLVIVRQIVWDKVFLLVPGVGAQGGDVEKTVTAAQNSSWAGFIVNSSSAIMFPKDSSKTPWMIAQATREEINRYRKAA